MDIFVACGGVAHDNVTQTFMVGACVLIGVFIGLKLAGKIFVSVKERTGK